MSEQQKIIEAIAEILGLPPTDIDLTAHFQDDLGLNPVEMADLYHNISDKFQIMLEPSELETVKTVGDFVELIEDKLLE